MTLTTEPDGIRHNWLAQTDADFSNVSHFCFPPPRLTRGKGLQSSDQILIRNISLKLSRLLSQRVKMMHCNLFRREPRSCSVFFVTHKTLSTLQLFGVKLLQTLLNTILRPHHLYSSQLAASFMIRGSVAWNNGKEVSRWVVAEIQKMSLSTTGRCYCCH